MQCPVPFSRMLLRDVRYWPSVCCYAMSGTVLAYGTVGCAVLTWAMLLRHVRWQHTMSADRITSTGVVHTPGAKSNEKPPSAVLIVRGLGSYRIDYALALRVLLCDVRYRDSVLVLSAYALATRCAVLRLRMVLLQEQYDRALRQKEDAMRQRQTQ
eukprot:2398299-Rhodomonas_salina.1